MAILTSKEVPVVVRIASRGIKLVQLIALVADRGLLSRDLGVVITDRLGVCADLTAF